jgi:hypothetical protein
LQLSRVANNKQQDTINKAVFKVRKSKPDSTAQKIRMDDPESNINFRIAILHNVCALKQLRQTLETLVRQQQLRAVAITKPYASNGSFD